MEQNWNSTEKISYTVCTDGNMMSLGAGLGHQVVAERLPHVYGHITLKTPVLVRSLKLSNVEPS